METDERSPPSIQNCGRDRKWVVLILMSLGVSLGGLFGGHVYAPNISIDTVSSVSVSYKPPLSMPSANGSTEIVVTMKANTSMTTFQNEGNFLPYCLWSSFYGRTGNRIFSLARIWHRAVKNKRPLALSPSWSDWYRQHFDVPMDGAFLHLDFCHSASNPKACFEKNCFKRFRGEQAYRMNPDAVTVPELATDLLPKASIRHRAELIVAHQRQASGGGHSSKLITVHRRNFEGVCARRAHSHRVADRSCPTADSLPMCYLNHTDVALRHLNSNDNAFIWLFTDGQVPILDDTFPHRFNASEFESSDGGLYSETEAGVSNRNLIGVADNSTNVLRNLLVEMWIMAQSDEHWGHPESTVDQTVYHWRNYQRMVPTVCFPSNPSN